VSRSARPACGAGHGTAAPAPGDVRSVVLVDRDASRLADLADELERNGVVTLAAATTFASARTELGAAVPSVVVVDAGLDDGTITPLEEIALLRRRHPDVKVVCLDDAADRQSIGRLLAAGADAVFLRQSAPGELARAIRRLVHDDTVFAPVSGWVPPERHRRSLAPPLLEV
jgi:DNA-binding NarL/FixJ family response regulator